MSGESSWGARIPLPLRGRGHRRLTAGIAFVALVAGCAGSPPSAPPAAADPPIKLVVLGDSIPNNSPQDCPGCTGFVDRYATSIKQSTGREIETANLSEHTGLTLPDLLEKLPQFESQLREADVIVIGAAHNSIVLGSERPCGSTLDEEDMITDWSKLDARCAETSAAKLRPAFDELFSSVAALRAGQPTVLRTINKYSDWIGWEEARLSADEQRKTVVIHDAWNEMLCDSATANEFVCVDIYHAFNGPDGNDPAGPLLASDYVHPSNDGNALIAETLIDSGLVPLA